MTVRRVAVLNVVASNTGDAAILQALIERVHAAFDDVESIVVYESQPDVVKRLYPEIDVRLSGHVSIAEMRSSGRLGGLSRRLNRCRLLLAARELARGRHRVAGAFLRPVERLRLRELQSYDLILSTGGTYLVENYVIWPRLLDLEIVLALGRPLVLFTQSLGPFTASENRRQMRNIVNGARLVLLRDDRSRANLVDLGADVSRTLIRSDAAFALASPERLNSAGRGVHRVAISVRDWPYHGGGLDGTQRYFDAVAAAATSLAERGIDVVFLSTCQGVAEYTTDDSRCAQAIFDRLADNAKAHCHVNAAFHRPGELIDELAGFDAVISTRMHGAILAIGAGVPVLPVAYEFKTHELFARLGLSEWVTDIESIEPRSFVRLTLRFVDEVGDVKASMRAAALAERELAVSVADDLRRAITA